VKSQLKVLRAEKGWSQGDLADKAHVSRQTINAIETGKYEPSLSLAFRLAAIFELPIESVFQPDRDPDHQNS
jgi:putative transcriptional regulator